MQKQTITFQTATQYLPKIALRIEYLYQSVYQACEQSHPIVHHYALKSVLEILQLIEKPELKSRFLKELMRIEHKLNKSEQELPTNLSNRLYTHIQMLTHIVGMFGEGIHQDPFLQVFRQNLPSHNQDCEIQPPQLLYWMESEAEKRQEDLALWLKNLHALYVTSLLYLQLLRSTAEFVFIPVRNGFYQQSLPPKVTCQLILVRIDTVLNIVPRIQFGHHGLSIRFCEATSLREIQDSETPCDLAICQL